MLDREFVEKLQELDAKGKDGVAEMREVLRGNMGKLIKLAAAGLEKSPKAKSLAARGTRWPADREVPAEWLDSAAARRAKAGLPAIDLRQVAEEFVTYWPSVAGKAGIKLDWKLTFENRCIQARAPTPRQGRFAETERPAFEDANTDGWVERLKVFYGWLEAAGGAKRGSWLGRWGYQPDQGGNKVPPAAWAAFKALPAPADGVRPL